MHHSIITVSTKPGAQRDMLSKVNAGLDIRPENCITCDPIVSFTLSEGCRKTGFIKFSILYFQKCCARYYFNPRTSMRRPQHNEITLSVMHRAQSMTVSNVGGAGIQREAIHYQWPLIQYFLGFWLSLYCANQS